MLNVQPCSGCGPVFGILPADGPQRLDLDERLTGAAAGPDPPLTRGGSGPQQVIEDLVILLGRNRFDRGGDVVNAGVQRVGENQTCSVKIPLLNARNSFADGLMCSTGWPNAMLSKVIEVLS